MGIAAIAAARLWSLAGLLIKLLDWNPMAIACGRSAIAALFLLVWLRKPRFDFSPAQLFAALAYSATMLLFVYANKATTSANAILLQYGEPVYVAIIGSFVLKEKPRAEHWIAFGLVAIGMGLFFAGGVGGGSLAATRRPRRREWPSPSIRSSCASRRRLAPRVGPHGPRPHRRHRLRRLPLPAGARFDARSLAVIATLGVVQIGLASVFFAMGSSA